VKPVMYIFVNTEVGMSPGKLAAQAAHAAVEAYRISENPRIDAWYVGGHHTKLIMDGGSELRLKITKDYLEWRGFSCELVIDEGRTEVEPFTATALGVEIVDKDDEHTAATFGDFKTLRPPRPEQPIRRAPAWMHFRRRKR
jgi:peptidyl-tRNA hydrolase, PTH2 family